MIRLNQVVVVEGKYDKITLSDYIDAIIITTDGFSVFKDKEKQRLISYCANKNGIVIITDSDSAGMQIRAFLKNICKSDNITNVYIPQIIGKERRKKTPSKEGFLGVEGMTEEIIKNALIRSGVNSCDNKRLITKKDLFLFGLSGRDNSSKKRESFLKFSGLPLGLSGNGFLDAVNAILGYDDFYKAVKLWEQEEDKN